MMDPVKTAEVLKRVAALVESVPKDRLNGVAVIIPPDGSNAIEVVLVGAEISGFAEYVISQIKNAAQQQHHGMMPGGGMVGVR